MSNHKKTMYMHLILHACLPGVDHHSSKASWRECFSKLKKNNDNWVLSNEKVIIYIE